MIFFRSRALLGALLLLTSIVMLGCRSYPPAPATAAAQNYRYVLGPGDVVNIVVWRNPELSTTVTVRPDGKIAAPLVEELQAAGKDPSTLARDIEKVLSRVIRDPVVNVIAAGAMVGPYSEQIRVVGEAARPQVLAYRHKMTLLDVMIAVGGITDFADGNSATIVRTSEGKQGQYSVRIRDLLKRGDISANVEMVPGDVVIIPQTWF